MTRKQLLNLICPSNKMHNCENYHCIDCNLLLIKLLDEYDKHVIEQYKLSTNIIDTIRDIHDNVAQEMYCKGVDDFANWLVEQGILGNRCISDGEITDYGKVYAKKYKEQLKAGGKNEID